jgi:hypothetical protein
MHGSACQIIIELTEMSLIAIIFLFVRCYPEQKIFMIESYFRTVHKFRESASVQRKPGSGRLKVHTDENIETAQRQM